MQVPLSDVQVLQDHGDGETANGDKDETFAQMKEWKRQYMRGISHTPSQAGVYYEALKGSSHSLAKGCGSLPYIILSCSSTFNLNLLPNQFVCMCVCVQKYLIDTHASFADTICLAD